MRVKDRLLVIPDTHRPYHDPLAWALALKVARAFDPTIVVNLGDFGDFYAVSMFSKSPARKQCLQWEADVCKQGTRELEEATPSARRRVFLAGNHEFRLQRYLESNAPALSGMRALKLPVLFGLESWEYVKYKESVKIGEVYYNHDAGYAGKDAHEKTAKSYGWNAVIGHSHHAGVSYLGNHNGDRIVAVNGGWLGNLEAVDYMHRDKAKMNWTHAVTIAYVLDNGHTHFQLVPFVKGAAVLNGQIISLTAKEERYALSHYEEAA